MPSGFVHMNTGKLCVPCWERDKLGGTPTLGCPFPGEGCSGLAPAPQTHHAFQNFAKHHVLAIQPGCLNGRDKELGAIGVLACVGHAHPARPVVFQLEVLIGEAFTIDALSWEGRVGQGAELAQTKPIFGVRIPGTQPVFGVRPGSSGL